QLCEPGVAQLLAALANAASEALPHLIGHKKLRIFGPTVVSFRESDLFFAERFAVGCVRVLFIRRAPGDVGIDNDERWTFGFFLRNLKGALEHLRIICVADTGNVPAITDKASGDVF